MLKFVKFTWTECCQGLKSIRRNKGEVCWLQEDSLSNWKGKANYSLSDLVFTFIYPYSLRPNWNPKKKKIIIWPNIRGFNTNCTRKFYTVHDSFIFLGVDLKTSILKNITTIITTAGRLIMHLVIEIWIILMINA